MHTCKFKHVTFEKDHQKLRRQEGLASRLIDPVNNFKLRDVNLPLFLFHRIHTQILNPNLGERTGFVQKWLVPLVGWQSESEKNLPLPELQHLTNADEGSNPMRRTSRAAE
jgi:hypothetical protein